MTEPTDRPVLEGAQVSDFVTRLIVWGLLASLTVTAMGVREAFASGFSPRALIFLLGGLISACILVGLPLHAAFGAYRGRKKSLVGMLVSYGGLVPLLFSVYLMLYECFWRLTRLRHGFSFRVILGSLFFAGLAIILFKAIDRASLFARHVDKGQIVLR